MKRQYFKNDSILEVGHFEESPIVYHNIFVQFQFLSHDLSFTNFNTNQQSSYCFSFR